MSQQRCQHCNSLLQEFLNHREKSLLEKEQMKKELEKCKQMLEKFTNKIDKRVDARIREDKNVSAHRMEEMEESHRGEMEQWKGVLAQKDRVIEEMRYLLRALETEKRELIQNNTRVLVQLSQGIENNVDKPSEAIDHNNKELMKMYQFLIDENNELKKEIYLLKKQIITGNVAKNESFLIKEERSLHNSEYKTKSITDSSKGDVFMTSKIQPKDKPKEKSKKPPTHKGGKK